MFSSIHVKEEKIWLLKTYTTIVKQIINNIYLLQINIINEIKSRKKQNFQNIRLQNQLIFMLNRKALNLEFFY